MKIQLFLCQLLALVLFISCENASETTLSGLKKKDFQTEVDGQLTDLFVLTNGNGMEACITNYGARLVSLMAPNRDGEMQDVVLGFPTIQEYMSQKQNFGATVGRYIGRIRNAKFSIDSVEYQLTPNQGQNCIHGGTPGFAEKIWQAEQLDLNAVRLSYLSLEGENGFPGNLRVHLVYLLTDNNELQITYEAETDAPTVVNLSHHSFFNLSGHLTSTVEDEFLYVNANAYTPCDSTKCATGETLPVEGTPFDFTTLQRIGDRINDPSAQITLADGYDHTWVLNTNGRLSVLAAKVVDHASGRVMEVYTDEPGLQIYTANSLKERLVGKKGIAYPRRSAICLEAMHFQDSPNQPQFPSTLLMPEDIYSSHCTYRFSVSK